PQLQKIQLSASLLADFSQACEDSWNFDEVSPGLGFLQNGGELLLDGSELLDRKLKFLFVLQFCIRIKLIFVVGIIFQKLVNDPITLFNKRLMRALNFVTVEGCDCKFKFEGNLWEFAAKGL